VENGRCVDSLPPKNAWGLHSSGNSPLGVSEKWSHVAHWWTIDIPWKSPWGTMSHPISSWFVLYIVIIISYYYYYCTFIILVKLLLLILVISYYIMFYNYLYYKMVLPTLRLWPFLALMDALTKRCGCEGLRLRSAVNVKSGIPKSNSGTIKM